MKNKKFVINSNGGSNSNNYENNNSNSNDTRRITVTKSVKKLRRERGRK